MLLIVWVLYTPQNHCVSSTPLSSTLYNINYNLENIKYFFPNFQIGKQDIMAHRVVLAAVSPYFAELFSRYFTKKIINYFFHFTKFFLLFSSDHGSRKEVEGGGIIYEMEGGFSKDALEILVDYAYTST